MVVRKAGVNYSLLQNAIMQQAYNKKFGTTPAEVIVSEKIALIHSEITEAHDAFQGNNFCGKDGFEEELGDVFQRTVHLGGAYGIDFSRCETIQYEFPVLQFPNVRSQLLLLHDLTSRAWESYRHANMNSFELNLLELAETTSQVAETYSCDLETAVLAKIDFNKDRVWNKKDMNEKFVS